MAEPAEQLLSVRDVAEAAQLEAETIRRAIRAGELRASKMRGRLRIRPEDFADWIESTRIEPVRLQIAGSLPTPPVHARAPATVSYREKAKNAA